MGVIDVDIYRILSRVSLLMVFLFVAWTPTRAQVAGSDISGTITDSSGGVVAGAQISVRNKDTDQTRETTSNDQGFYSVPNLNPGDYETTVSREGFEKAIAELTLTVGAKQVHDSNRPRNCWLSIFFRSLLVFSRCASSPRNAQAPRSTPRVLLWGTWPQQSLAWRSAHGTRPRYSRCCRRNAGSRGGRREQWPSQSLARRFLTGKLATRSSPTRS
jgi:Carboxypeptidase regulatory-like domain